MYSENALRDTVEMLGCPVVMGHTHTIQTQPGRCVGAPVGYSAGLLADPDSLDYASARRATLRWRTGWLYGEVTNGKTTVLQHYSAGLGGTIKPAFEAGID